MINVYVRIRSVGELNILVREARLDSQQAEYIKTCVGPIKDIVHLTGTGPRIHKWYYCNSYNQRDLPYSISPISVDEFVCIARSDTPPTKIDVVDSGIKRRKTPNKKKIVKVRQDEEQQMKSKVWMCCAVKAATEAEARDGKGDKLVGKLEAVVAETETGAAAKYAQEFLKEQCMDGVEVQVQSFR